MANLCDTCINFDDCVSEQSLKEYCITHDYAAFDESPLLWYKNYCTIPKWYEADRIYYGKIENTHDLVNFHGYTRSGFLNEFHNAVDDYIAFRQEIASYEK